MLIKNHFIIYKKDIKYIADRINDNKIGAIKKLDLSCTNLSIYLLKELFYLIKGNNTLEEIKINNN